MKDKLLKLFEEFLETAIGDSANDKTVQENTTVVKGVEVCKAVDEMERRALFVVMEPQNDDGTTNDLHGDWFSEQDCIEACRSFNVHCQKANLYHQIMVDSDVAVIEQSFTAPTSFELTRQDGTVQQIKKGTWLQEWHFPINENNDTWDKILSGHFTGLSPKCDAWGYELED